MLLLCETSVVDRRHVKSAPIPSPSQITLVDEFSNFQKQLYLQIVQTINGSSNQERYQLMNNIAKLDTQYVNDNILCISMRNPKYNIFIKCDKAQLNFFVKTLKCSVGIRTGNPFRPNGVKQTMKFAPKSVSNPRYNNGSELNLTMAASSGSSQPPKPIGGIGMKLLQNMGWKPGEGLGKDKTGLVEPLHIEQKKDKIGLYTSGDNIAHLTGPHPQNRPRKPKVELTFEGKHPVSQLCEIAARNKWNVPEYEITMLKESDMQKQFFFRVTVNGINYESSVEALKKKDAKLFAAQYALQELGYSETAPSAIKVILTNGQ